MPRKGGYKGSKGLTKRIYGGRGKRRPSGKWKKRKYYVHHSRPHEKKPPEKPILPPWHKTEKEAKKFAKELGIEIPRKPKF